MKTALPYLLSFILLTCPAFAHAETLKRTSDVHKSDRVQIVPDQQNGKLTFVIDGKTVMTMTSSSIVYGVQTVQAIVYASGTTR